MSLKKLAAGAALTTLAALSAQGALAQSTASQVSEVVVTTSRAAQVGSVAIQTQVAKDQAIVTSQYIATQVGTSNVAQLINLLPGVSYSTEDPTGLLSSDLRVHGFDGNHVAITIDGTPVNDSGNYASFPGEYVPAEVTDRITVNVGGAEVDAPTASSLGATVNIVTKLPPVTAGAQGSVAGGSYNFVRGYGEIDTGEVGPWGTRAFFSANYANSDKYKGGGTLNRWGVDGRIYQPLRDNDFISVAYLYVQERSDFYESSSLAQFQQLGHSLDYNTRWAVPSVTPGKADVPGPLVNAQPGFEQAPLPGSSPAAADTGQGYWADHPNPVNFGDIRVQSRFDLSHGFTFTFDPSFFYTLANGGGITSLKESDARLIGNQAAKTCGTGGGSGVDLNGDADCLDTVLVYSPSNTQTDRFGVLSSLLWDMDSHNHFQLGYTLDYANHRQTGLYGTIDQTTGVPTNVFGGLQGPQILSQDGTPLRSRDRFSVAELNQIAFNYIGRWMDDKLHVNLGVRDPYFTRHINQYCFLDNGGSQYCDSISQAAVQTAYNAGVAAHNATALSTLLGVTVNYDAATGTPNFRFPFSQTFHFNKILPNAGATYNFDSKNQIYISYSQGFAAPKTDDLYVTSQILVQPETTDNYAGGYRYTSSKFTASASIWGATWHNHIVQSFDPLDPTQSIDRNVGEVQLYGADLEAGFHPYEPWQFFATATLENSALQNNYFVGVSSGPDKGASIALPVKGKSLVLTPNLMLTLRAQYQVGPIRIGANAKYTGQRFADDMNTAPIPGYTVVDLDAAYDLGKHVTVSLNATNVLNSQYIVRLSTVGAANDVHIGPDTVFGSSTFYYYNAPPMVYAKLAFKW